MLSRYFRYNFCNLYFFIHSHSPSPCLQVIFLLSSLSIALSLSNLGTILAIVGATGSTAVSLVVPGFAYYFTFQADPDQGPLWKRQAALLLGCLGLAIFPVCVGFILAGAT